MKNAFDVGHLSVDRLLSEWRWLCPQPLTLIACNAFGDLFLRDESGKVLKLDVSVGQLTEVSPSDEEFRVAAASGEKRAEWFKEEDERAGEEQGLVPGSHQCIGFKIPLMFAQSGRPGNAYVADLYEQVSFLGDLNRQVATLPDGTKVRLKVTD
jgi:hypothetical protein